MMYRWDLLVFGLNSKNFMLWIVSDTSVSTKSWAGASAPRANRLSGVLTSTRLTQLQLREPQVPRLYRGALLRRS